MPLDFEGGFASGNPGHLEIHDQQVIGLGLEKVDGFLAIGRLIDGDIREFGRDDQIEELTNQFIVIGEQNSTLAGLGDGSRRWRRSGGGHRGLSRDRGRGKGVSRRRGVYGGQIKHLGYGTGQKGLINGFGEIDPGAFPLSLQYFGGGMIIPGHEKDGQVGIKSVNGAEGVESIHAREHDQIQEDEIDGRLGVTQETQSVFSGVGSDGLITRRFEHITEQSYLNVVVIDH